MLEKIIFSFFYVFKLFTNIEPVRGCLSFAQIHEYNKFFVTFFLCGQNFYHEGTQRFFTKEHKVQKNKFKQPRRN